MRLFIRHGNSRIVPLIPVDATFLPEWERFIKAEWRDISSVFNRADEPALTLDVVEPNTKPPPLCPKEGYEIFRDRNPDS